MPNKYNIGLIAAVIALVCIGAYAQGLTGPLFFDDVPNLTANHFLQIDGRDFDDWRVAILSSDSGALHRPVAMFTFAVNYFVSGDFSPAGLKATNLAIHLLIAVCIYYLCLALLRAPVLIHLQLARDQCQVVAMMAAAFWLLHPVHVSTVLYAIQRMAQLSTLFVIAGLLLFTHYRLRWAESAASIGDLIATGLWLMLLAGLAVLSKENGALLPWLIAVVEVTLFRGIWGGRPNRPLVWLGWGVFALPIVFIAWVFLVSPETICSGFVGREFSLEERLLTQGRLLWRYLGWILLPNILDMGFFHDDIPLSRDLWSPYTTGLSLLAWALVVAVSLLLRKRYPLLVFAVFFYLVAHSMESTFLALEMVFEHRNYLPSVGICLLVAVTLLQFSSRFERLRLRVVLGSVLSLLVVLLAVRTHAWSDEMTLARYNAINHPASARANFFYANALFKRFEQAEVLELPEEERRSLAVAAREYFLRMHTIDERDFAPLVMLYQIDSSHFPGLAEDNDWLSSLEVLTKTRRLQSSDLTALGALVDFSGTVAGRAGRARVDVMLEQLVERYQWRLDLVHLRYKLLSGQDNIDTDQLRALLLRAAEVNPNGTQAYIYLVQYHGHENIATTYETIRTWMQRDSGRRDLSVIRRIFDN